jgi:Zinc-binding dehydrogenase
MASSAGPARTVPIARPLPSGFGTLVETRMYSSPLFAKSVAVIPPGARASSQKGSLKIGLTSVYRVLEGGWFGPDMRLIWPGHREPWRLFIRGRAKPLFSPWNCTIITSGDSVRRQRDSWFRGGNVNGLTPHDGRFLQPWASFLKQIGVDHVIDYKATGNLTEALLQAAPNGLDVYFDNVGGEHLEAALTAANRFARFTLCGMISQYNVAGMPAGPRNIMFAVGKSIRLEGFIVSNHFNLLPEFQKDMSGWIREGKLTWKEPVEHGIENAPIAFLKLFKGENLGKMLVKLA